MYCPFCECELPDEAKYCHNCGNKLPESNETDSEHVAELSGEDIEVIPAGDKPKEKNTKIGKTVKIIGIIIIICLLVVAACFVFSDFASNNNVSFNPHDARLASDLSEAIEPTNSDVRTYALRAISASHAGEYNIHQVCDIYTKVNKDWVYVNDPGTYDSSVDEYIAPASESVEHLRGDCEDYAILMVSLVEAIGGNARIVTADNPNGERHSYPEVCLSDFKEGVQYALDIVERKSGGTAVHYHIDDEGNYWLNLDWTASYPGGEFYESVGNELVTWPDGKYNRGTLISGNSADSNGEYSSTYSKYASAISKAIEPTDSDVQSYAEIAIPSSRKGDYTIRQLCDIYNKLYKEWKYVDGSAGEEYIAPASESVTLLRGDSIDYAVLMASLVEAIGGDARVVVVDNAEGGKHAYAEVYLTDSEEELQKLIDTIAEHYGGGYLYVYYHIDSSGEYWLNLDRTAKNPGGKLFESNGGELFIWPDGKYVVWN